MDLARSTSSTPTTESARPYRGRRVSWEEFYSLRPDLKPANDNRQLGSLNSASLRAVGVRS